MRLIIAAAAILGLFGTEQAAAATAGASAPGLIADPLEGWNRGVYGFNNGLDRAVVRPLAMTYRRALPTPARDGVRNVLSNVGAPVVFGPHVANWRAVYDDLIAAEAASCVGAPDDLRAAFESALHNDPAQARAARAATAFVQAGDLAARSVPDQVIGLLPS